MKILISVICILVGVVPGVSRAQAPTKTDGLAEIAALLGQHHEPEASSPALTLKEVERIALAENPEIAVAARRVAIAEAHVPAAGSLDDPNIARPGAVIWAKSAPQWACFDPDLPRAADGRLPAR